MSDTRGRVIAVATDGACSGNPGPGGWGALIRFEDGTVEELGGFEPHTTNNRMELKAALKTLEKLKELPRLPELKIRTDSKYLINGLTQWISNWKLKGWKTSAGKPVLNKDLWQALDQAKLSDVSLEYVKGHSGDPDNERVDKIAVSFSRGVDISSQCHEKSKPLELIPNPAYSSSTQDTQPGPQKLQKLLSRLEMADKFAKCGYSLTSNELAQLVNQPVQDLKQKKDAWQWRDWIVEPISNNRWRMHCLNQSKVISGEDRDD